MSSRHHASVVAVPPPNYAIVDHGIVRSAYPSDARHVHYLRQHARVRTVVQLSLENLPGPVVAALAARTAAHGGVDHNATTTAAGPSPSFHHTDVDAPRVLHVHPPGNEWRNAWANNRGTQEFLRIALDYVLDASMHPMLLCCPTGEVETSMVVGCLRRMQRWSVASIFAEAELYVSSTHQLPTMVRSVLETFVWDPQHYTVVAMTQRKQHREAEAFRSHDAGVGARIRLQLGGGDARHMLAAPTAPAATARHHHHIAASAMSTTQSDVVVPGEATDAHDLLSVSGIASSLQHLSTSLSVNFGRSTSPGGSSVTSSTSLEGLRAWAGAEGGSARGPAGRSIAIDTVPVQQSAALLQCLKFASGKMILVPHRLLPFVDAEGVPPGALGSALAPHEKYWWTVNPPALDDRSSFNRNESLVEEDDD